MILTHKIAKRTIVIHILSNVGDDFDDVSEVRVQAPVQDSEEDDSEKDIAYPVKQIQADIKNSLNVDISYSKAWQARKKVIETIYGTWESNFAELPKYIATLQASNIFFGHFAIDAFHLCRPVISVDGAHLKGSYKGKMLVVVTKDANNNILPVAYAIVDEETVHSWCWFFFTNLDILLHTIKNYVLF